MTYIDREQVFAKDYITTQDLMLLLGIKSVSDASRKMSEMKRKVGDRLGIKGKIHTEDYFLYFGITDRSRYTRPRTEYAI